MTWDATTPAGNESKAQGDDRIRELKEDLETALTDEGVFPGPDDDNPVYRGRGRKGTTAARPAAGNYGFYFDETRNAMQRDNGAAWQDVGTLIPAGTKAIFFQANPPTGWAIDATQNDKALRVVSGTGGGAAGTHDLSSPPSTAHTHSISSDGAHLHNLSQTDLGGGYEASNSIGYNKAGVYGNSIVAMRAGGFGEWATINHYTETSSTHNHGAATGSGSPTAFAPKYIDVIVCTKS